MATRQVGAMTRLALLLYVALVLLLLRPASAAREFRCVDAGVCQQCTKAEAAEDYCQEFQRKMKMVCTPYGAAGGDRDREKTDFRPCPMTAEDDQGAALLSAPLSCCAASALCCVLCALTLVSSCLLSSPLL